MFSQGKNGRLGKQNGEGTPFCIKSMFIQLLIILHTSRLSALLRKISKTAVCVCTVYLSWVPKLLQAKRLHYSAFPGRSNNTTVYQNIFSQTDAKLVGWSAAQCTTGTVPTLFPLKLKGLNPSGVGIISIQTDRPENQAGWRYSPQLEKHDPKRSRVNTNIGKGVGQGGTFPPFPLSFHILMIYIRFTKSRLNMNDVK